MTKVERRAVSRCGGNHGQTGMNRDTSFEAQQLGRDLALIMIHGYNAVEIAAAGGDEKRIGRQGASHIQTFRLQLPDGGTDNFHFLGAH